MKSLRGTLKTTSCARLSRIGRRLALYGRPRLEAMTFTTGLNRTAHIRLLANLRDKPNPDTLPIPRQLPRSQQTARIPQQLPLRPVANAWAKARAKNAWLRRACRPSKGSRVDQCLSSLLPPHGFPGLRSAKSPCSPSKAEPLSTRPRSCGLSWDMSSGTFIGQRLNPASDERANDRDRAMSSSGPRRARRSRRGAWLKRAPYPEATWIDPASEPREASARDAGAICEIDEHLLVRRKRSNVSQSPCAKCARRW